jgi:hypothetical protein
MQESWEQNLANKMPVGSGLTAAILSLNSKESEEDGCGVLVRVGEEL